jgi:predicted patatin/cPLA2 family phospholipase
MVSGGGVKTRPAQICEKHPTGGFILVKTGLVLEGGGMRGLFTAGVLDAFIDRGIEFPYIIGVSAGVCHGISYLTKQRGRTRSINIDNIGDKRYVSFKNLIKTGSMFGMDFIFDDIPNKLYPFDFDSFNKSKAEFVTGVTDVKTGRPVYFGNDKKEHINLIARASSAIPVFSPIVEFEGGLYLDGGTSDPIPVEKALEDGCDKAVVVLTRDSGFVRPPEKLKISYRRMYRKYPEMVRCLDAHHEKYNGTREYLTRLEAQGRAFVIAPPQPVAIGRFERNREKLQALYEQGYNEAARQFDVLEGFLGT